MCAGRWHLQGARRLALSHHGSMTSRNRLGPLAAFELAKARPFGTYESLQGMAFSSLKNHPANESYGDNAVICSWLASLLADLCENMFIVDPFATTPSVQSYIEK